MEYDVEIANVVGSISYQQELDLQELANTFNTHSSISEVTYEPAENHWLQTRIGDDDVYVAFYRSGKVSIVGCDSVEGFHEMADTVNEIMKELLEYDYTPEVEISNVVSTATLNLPIPLEQLSIALGLENVEYEPEQFPAILYRPEDAAVLIFSSGKIVITGLRNPKQAVPIVEELDTQIQSLASEQ